MIPINFEGANTILHKPKEMTDEQCMSVHAYSGVDTDGFPFTLTVWQPNKEDIEAILAGRPVCLKVLGQQPPPVSMYTYDADFNPNV
jgi:hypothetical protein